MTARRQVVRLDDAGTAEMGHCRGSRGTGEFFGTRGKERMVRRATILLTLSMITTTMGWPQPVPGTPPVQRPNRPHDPSRTESLTFVLRAGGFGTDRIRVPTGRYHVSVFNRTGKDNLPIVFERTVGDGVPTQGQAIRNTIADARTSRFVERLALQRGTYRLRVPTHPRWVLTIEVN